MFMDLIRTKFVSFTTLYTKISLYSCYYIVVLIFGEKGNRLIYSAIDMGYQLMLTAS